MKTPAPRHSRLRLLYVYPAAHEEVGPELKREHQLRALASAYHVSISAPPAHSQKTSLVRSLARYFLYQAVACVRSLRHDVIYYRYSPFWPGYNAAVALLSCFRKVFVEYNTAFLLHRESKPWHKALHRFALWLLRRSAARHLAVTEEIARLEKLPPSHRIMPNGYGFHGHTSPAGPPEERYERFRAFAQERTKKGGFILCFVCTSEFYWHGFDRIAQLVLGLPQSALLLIGNVPLTGSLLSLKKSNRLYATGMMEPHYLPQYYELCHAGLGSFNLTDRGLTESASLKVREYLWYGLRVVLRHKDPLEQEQWARPLIFQLNGRSTEDLRRFLAQPISKARIQAVARKELPWEKSFQRAGLL